MDAFATYAEATALWTPPAGTPEAKVETRLAQASALLRLAIPDIDARIADTSTPERTAIGANLAIAAKALVIEAARRVIDNPAGARRVQETIGPRGYSLDLGDGPTGIYLTDEELQPLQPNASGTRGEAIGTAIIGTRPGWAPHRHRRHGLWGWDAVDDYGWPTSP